VESFRETSDRLKELGISLQDQAAALGMEYQTLRIKRAEKPSAKGYRPPPEPSSWRSAWAKLLRERAEQLRAEADKLERSGAGH
jgi:hypothetical protein